MVGWAAKLSQGVWMRRFRHSLYGTRGSFMGRTPKIALAGILMAGLGATGCESFSLFRDRQAAQQNSFAAAPTPALNSTASAPGSAGWQHQPKSWTTAPVDPTGIKVSTSPGQNSGGVGPDTASRSNAPSPTLNNQNSTALGSNMTNAASVGFTNTAPSAMASPLGANTRTTNPPSVTLDPDATRAGNTSSSPSPGGKSSNFQDFSPALPTPGSSSTSSLQPPSLSSPTSGKSNSQYQTQYVNPSAADVKQMPSPGRGDE